MGCMGTQDEQPGLVLAGEGREPTLPRRIAGETGRDFGEVENHQAKGTASKQELARASGTMVADPFWNSNDDERFEIDPARLEVGAKNAAAFGRGRHDPCRRFTEGLDMGEIGDDRARLNAVPMARELDEPPRFEKLGPMRLGQRRLMETCSAHVQ